MKTGLIAATPVLTLALALAAPAAAKPHGHAHREAGQAELLKLEDDWVAAEMNKDAETLRRILDPGFVLTVGEAPPRVGREPFIASVMANPHPAQQALSDRMVLIRGRTGVIVDVDTLSKPADPAYRPYSARITTTYVRDHGQWRALAEHMSRIPEPPPGGR